MFEFVAGQEQEPEPIEEGVFNYVHVVTSKLFNIAEVFAGEDDALHYALQIFNAIGHVGALTYSAYMEEYVDAHVTTVRAADSKSMVAVTVRKKRIRRDKCYILGNE